MQITEIRVSVTKTFNLGNFNSMRLEAGATATLDSADDPKACREALYAEVQDSLAEQWTVFRR